MPDSPTPDPAAVSRKGKERQAPQPTDFAEKLVALQRRQAQTTKPKQRPDRPQPPSTSATKAAVHPPSPRRTHAPPTMQPSIVVSQAFAAADGGPDEQDFSRRLRITPASPRHTHARAEHTSSRGTGKLYNPHAEPSRRPNVTAEPDAMSEAASSSYAPRPPPPHASSRSHHRSQTTRGGGEPPRLFDPRRDNPTQFNMMSRTPGPSAPPTLGRPTPTPKSSGDWVSASSTSSYAHSTISSSFTLNTTTTDSSASSALFDNGQRSEDSTASSNVLSSQLKHLYRKITALEGRLLQGDREAESDDIYEDASRIGVLQKGQPLTGRTKQEEEAERERCRRLVQEHKELADVVHQLLTVTLSPSVPVSLRNIPLKYNLVTRLWVHAFHRLLEALRRSAISSSHPDIALENLVELIYYAYKFYAGLMDEHNLAQFRGNWVECLGDVARYRMAVTALIDSSTPSIPKTLPVNAVTRAALSGNHLSPGPATPDPSALSDKNQLSVPGGSPTPAARIDDSPQPSISEQPPQPGMAPSVGIVAARLMELEPEKERWRQVSRDWYSKGLAFTPGAGKLHHHLGVLSRDREGGEKEELRAAYHFVKSMITVHPFTTSREAVLPLWSPPAQKRRQAPDAGLTELFVLLHGMMFTNIELDDFKVVLARFEEKLIIEGDDAQERDWIMMAVINIGSILEYGRSTAVLRRVAGTTGRETIPGTSASPIMSNGANKVKLMAKRADADEKKMDVDDDGVNDTASPAMADATIEPELPSGLKYALQLTFGMLTHVLSRPYLRRSSPLARPPLNPYITILLTFVATTLKDKTAERVLKRAIPWEPLAAFLTAETPRKVMQAELQREHTLLLSSGCYPLSEDWCLRGLGWGGKKIYERGFWDKATRGDEISLEAETLDKTDTMDLQEGFIEDDGEDDEQAKRRPDARRAELVGRWTRVARSAIKIAKTVSGFTYAPPVVQDGRGEWRVEGQLADQVAQWREEDAREKFEEERRLRGTRWDSDEDDEMDVDDDDVPMGGDDSEDEDVSDEIKALKERLRYLHSFLRSSPRSAKGKSRAKGQLNGASRVRMVPGYTTLVLDTNVLLSSLPVISSLVESLQWTVVIPLPVIMELDGLSSDSSPLGEAASAASAFIVSHLRTHGAALKIQTSKGNFLSNLNVRTEQVDFTDEASWERNMDDLILRAAMWQTEHWTDRSVFLKVAAVRDTTGASKVALLTFDRMLRLKARSRDVDAASEQDLASLLTP